MSTIYKNWKKLELAGKAIASKTIEKSSKIKVFNFLLKLPNMKIYFQGKVVTYFTLNVS